jgi:hypothetical protein
MQGGKRLNSGRKAGVFKFPIILQVQISENQNIFLNRLENKARFIRSLIDAEMEKEFKIKNI